MMPVRLLSKNGSKCTTTITSSVFSGFLVVTGVGFFVALVSFICCLFVVAATHNSDTGCSGVVAWLLVMK